MAVGFIYYFLGFLMVVVCSFLSGDWMGRIRRVLFVLFLETVSYSPGYLQTLFIVEDDLEFLALLSLTPECWDYALPCPFMLL